MRKIRYDLTGTGELGINRVTLEDERGKFIRVRPEEGKVSWSRGVYLSFGCNVIVIFFCRTSHKVEIPVYIPKENMRRVLSFPGNDWVSYVSESTIVSCEKNMTGIVEISLPEGVEYVNALYP